MGKHERIFDHKRGGGLRILAVCLVFLLLLQLAPISAMAEGTDTATTVLDCHAYVHQHTDACYGEDGALICGEADYLLHQHSAECYDEEGNLVCPLPEILPHTHTADCYAERVELICGLEESEEHSHSDSCYAVTWELICGETEPHTHTVECYNEAFELICGKTQLLTHIHDDSCFTRVEEPITEPAVKAGGPRRVSGSQVAADGVYTSTITATKTSKNKNYYGTLYVYVEDGKISYLRIVASDKQDRFNTVAYEALATYGGQPATVSTVDAVTSASLTGSSTSSKYTVNLTEAMRNALSSAPAASTGSATPVEAAAAGVYTGTGTMANGHYITLDVTVDADGKISALSIADADGSWDSLLGQVSPNYISAYANDESVDAVTSATPNGYREAIATAIKNALRKAATGGSSGGSDPADAEKTVYTSGTVQTASDKTFTGPVYVEADAVITFENCTFPDGITLEDADAAAIVKNCTFGSESFGIKLASNLLGELPANTVVTKDTGLSAAFPETVANKEDGSNTSAVLVDSSLATVPSWAKGTYYSPSSGVYGYYLTGTTPNVEEDTYQSFNTYVKYEDTSGTATGDSTLAVTIPLTVLITPSSETPASSDGVSYPDPGSGTTRTTDGDDSLVLSKGVDVTNVLPGNTFALTLEAYATGETGTTTTSGAANILLVLDNTRSMITSFGSGTRLSTMQAAAKDFVSGLEANTDSKISMISFVIGDRNSPTTTNVAWTALTEAGKNSVKTAINSLTAPEVQYGYDTNFLTPINYAASILDSVSGNGNKTYVVFFTDGSDMNTLASVQSAVASVHSKADIVFSIGITNGSTEEQKAQAMASDPAYYYNVSNAAAMNTAFQNALSTIIEETSGSNTTLDATAVFRDVVNTEKFDVSGATATVTVYDYNNGGWTKLSGSAAAANGGSGTLSSWTNKSANDGTLTVNFAADGTVTITGFSYKDHYLPDSGTEASGINAQKLHLEITGLKLKDGAQTPADQTDVPTNDDTQSGLYKSSGDSSAVKYFPLPTVNIPGNPTLPEAVEHVNQITVKKEWADGASNHTSDTVTVQITPNSGNPITVTLNSNNSWTQTVNTDPDSSYTVQETKVTSNGADVTEQYTAKVSSPVMGTSTTQTTGWVEVEKGAVSAGNTYVFTYTSGNTTYALGRSGTSVIGSSGVLSNGIPSNDIGNDYKWQISAANSYYGDWYLKNLGNNYYLALASSSSTGYTPAAYLTTSTYYYAPMHLDDDGSIWNGYSTGYNMYASGSSVAAHSSSYTVFTPYVYSNVTTTTNTATYTITNTEKEPTVIPVSFLKVDENGAGLSGAKFILYKGTANDGTLASGTDGTLSKDSQTSFDLEIGATYYLSELQAPEGYQKLDKSVQITVSKDGITAIASGGTKTYAVSGDKTSGYTLTIPNEPKPVTLRVIHVAKEWADGVSDADKKEVTVEIRNGSSAAATLTLNSENGWAADWTAPDEATEYTVVETMIGGSAKALDAWTVTVSAPNESTKSRTSETLNAVAELQDGGTYVFGFGNYYLATDGSSIIAVEKANINASCQWIVEDTGSVSNGLHVLHLQNKAYPGKYLARDSSGLLLSDSASNVRINNDHLQVTNGSAYRSYAIDTSGKIAYGNTVPTVSLYKLEGSTALVTTQSYTITNTPKLTIDTGVWLEEHPFAMGLGGAVLGLGLMAMFAGLRRRRYEGAHE